MADQSSLRPLLHSYFIVLVLSRFINPMLPARLVLVVMCVCECVCGRADASALINEPVIIIYTSCSSSYHPIYSHHSLISFVRSLFVVLDVWCSRLRSCSCSCGFVHSGFVTALRVHSGFVTALQDSSSQHSSDHQSPSATILVL